MNLKVIGAGFGRTGTMSLKVALEELGFDPCYHMSELFENSSHADLWNAAADGERVDWEALLGGYAATVDWPGCSFYEELMEAYPDAKVLLSVRDPERWYERHPEHYLQHPQGHLFIKAPDGPGTICSRCKACRTDGEQPDLGRHFRRPVRGPPVRDRSLQPSQRGGQNERLVGSAAGL